MRARLLPVAFLLVGCASAPAPEPPAPPAPALAAPPTVAEAAPVDESPWEHRCDRLRSDLQSADHAKALAAAKTLGPWYLSLEEIRIQTQILVRHPHEALTPAGLRALGEEDGSYSFGSPDLVPLLKSLIAGDEPPLDPETIDDLHRIALPEHLPDLVRLLGPARREIYWYIQWLVLLVANNSDAHREAVAEGLLYTRACLVASVEGLPLPRLRDMRFPGQGSGTAEAFLARYTALLGELDASEYEQYERFPSAWLERWQRQEAPAATTEETAATEVEAYSPSEARAKSAELATRAPDAWRDQGITLDRLLPLLEVAAPDALDDLLLRWAERATDESRGEIAEWQERRASPTDRVHDASLILERLENGGAPDADVACLGLLGDRSRPVLDRIRNERHHGLYWPATAGLAIAGDLGARTEFLAFLGEDRIAVYDCDWDDVGFTLNGDPEAIRHWLSRIDANCCLRFWSDLALHRWYPTMPRGNTVTDTDDLVRRTREWWDRWKDRMRWSRLADGWVPMAE